MKIFLKIILSLPLLWLMYIVGGMNARLYYEAPVANGYNTDLYKQLKHLKGRREMGAAHAMQQMFPEGLMFFESLYGLAWADFIAPMDSDSEIYKQGMLEIEKSLVEVNSDLAKSIFISDAALEYGAFYNGWSTFLLGRKLEVTPSHLRDEQEVLTFKNSCERMALVLDQSESPYLKSYQNGCWPADVCVCVSALAMHDRMFEKAYATTLDTWVQKVKSNLDVNGLIPHCVSARDGRVLQEARGSSQALMLSFLPSIDSVFAKEQYTIFKSLFVDTRFGLNAITEYPKGSDGMGDVDSGPVILGIGSSGTIVVQRATLANGDFELSEQINNGIEALGFPSSDDELKYYLGGYLDIGDAFIAWTRSAKTATASVGGWQSAFHWWSLIVFIPCLLILFLTWRPKRKKENEQDAA